MANIHSTAVVASSALIGEGTTVGPYSIIGEHVVLGKNNRVGPHVVIEGHTEIGNGNAIFQFASVGSAPQDLKYRGEASKLLIGDENIIREYATLQPGTEGGGMLTQVGNKNLFMVSSHIGHDCKVGDRCVIANGVAVAGHVTIGSGVILGGLSAVHQYAHIGDLAMLGGGSMVAQDIPPYCIAQGDRACLAGINTIGLERAGVSPEDIQIIKNLYRKLFISRGAEGLVLYAQQLRQEHLGSPVAVKFLEFISAAKRGVAPGRKKEQEYG